jgi:uncharacterized Zn finger protein
MSIFKLTETLIRAQSTDQIFAQGQAYYQQGAVGTLVQRGETIEARIKISETIRHYPRIQFHELKVISTKCTCFKGEGWCEHITATLLKCLHDAKIELRPTLAALLTNLSQTQLRALISTLVKKHPNLLHLIEHLLQSQKVVIADEANKLLQVKIDLIRRQVRATLSYGFDNDPFREFLTRITTFIQSGEVPNALTILEVVTEESVRTWKMYQEEYEYEDDGSIADFFKELDTLWAEAFLSFERTLEQGEYWETCLNHWANELLAEGSYFTTALGALKYGWHYATFQQELRGEMEPSSSQVEEWSPDNQLVTIYLRLLLRRQRYQESLWLAKVSGRYLDYVVMLLKLNEKKEAFMASLVLLKRTVVEFIKGRKKCENDG